MSIKNIKPEGLVDTAPTQKPQSTKDLKKTRFCAFVGQGLCAYGTECIFAHDVAELRGAPDLSKTKMCPKVSQGNKCTNRNCNFAHKESELRDTPSFKKKRCIWFAKGQCQNGEDCGFAHGFKEVRPKEEVEEVRVVAAPPPGLECPAPPGLEPEIFGWAPAIVEDYTMPWMDPRDLAVLGMQETIAMLSERLAYLEGVAAAKEPKTETKLVLPDYQNFGSDSDVLEGVPQDETCSLGKQKSDTASTTASDNISVSAESDEVAESLATQSVCATDDSPGGGRADWQPSWSIGSALHATGGCKPCSWVFKTQGCSRGEACDTCHMCGIQEYKLFRKERLSGLKANRVKRKDKAKDAKNAEATPNEDVESSGLELKKATPLSAKAKPFVIGGNADSAPPGLAKPSVLSKAAPIFVMPTQWADVA